VSVTVRITGDPIDEEIQELYQTLAKADFSKMTLTDESGLLPCMLRAAYGKGYVDSLKSDDPLADARRLGLKP
jgi:hypothetical protein